MLRKKIHVVFLFFETADIYRLKSDARMHGLKYSRSLNTYRCQKRSVLQPGTAASVTQCVFWQQTDDLIELPRCIDRKASATVGSVVLRTAASVVTCSEMTI